MTLNRSFFAKLYIVGLLTFVVHELAHWLTGLAFGYDMILTLNRVITRGEALPLHAGLITAAGPAITILQAVVGYAWLKRSKTTIGFALLYMAFFMRLVATLVSLFNPNDEATLGILLGIGFWTLPLLVVLGLLALVWQASRHLDLTWKDHLACYGVASLAVATVVGADMWLFG
ncbi:MAG: hypothetical protein RhofKO_27260 [Rhodothermales bacterium]